MKICPRCLKQFKDGTLVECPDDGTALKAFLDQTTQLIGRVLDERWEIEEKIGEGGMGEVYRARQVNVDRIVAVKVLRLALASTEEYVSRFFREADIATSVQHPHFVSIYDFGQTPDDQLLYIAMELLEGTSLAAEMRSQRLPLIDVLTIATQTCAALAAAHDAKIVHRDLKPDNIFLVDVPEGGPFVKVLDFGIAKDLDSTNKVTRTGQLFGTPEYMSPEQCEGGDVDGRSDLYSLGCILYELLTGRSPFKRDSIIQTLIAQVSEDATPFNELEIPIPPQVRAIVEKLLEKHPDNRFENAIAAREALHQEIDRLKGHSMELREYEAVSAKLALRRVATETVSYSDLGHPLQLEGILADSARQAISSEAEKRRYEESEQATDRVEPTGGSSATKYLPLAVIPIIAAAAWYVAQPDAPTVDLAGALAAARSAGDEAVTTAGTSAHVATAESDARRRANGIALAAVAVVVSDDAPETDPKPRTETKKDRPKALLGVRTQTSMSQRLLSKQRELLRCYNQRGDQNDGGSVVFRFQVAPSGDADVTVRSVGLKSQAVLDCMKGVADRVTFAAADTAATFEKPLEFSAVKKP